MSRFAQIKQKFEAITERERILVIITGVVVILMLGYVSLVEPVVLKAEREQRSLAVKKAELLTVESQIAMVQNDLIKDPNDPLKSRIAALSKDLSETEQQLQQQTRDIVPAKQMSRVLRELLKQSSVVRLEDMESVPVVTLSVDEQDQASQIQLYQHGMKLVLSGSYFDIHAYLDAIESLPWRFYWRSFEYRVADYPRGEAEIELYTLSTNMEFIGV